MKYSTQTSPKNLSEGPFIQLPSKSFVSVCLSTYFLIKTVFLALGQKNETSLRRKGETEIHRGLWEILPVN